MERKVSLNAWANPAQHTSREIEDMAAHLERSATRPDQQLVNQALVEVLEPQRGEKLLEVGSGSGTLCRMMCHAIGGDGIVTGVDIAPAMCAIAKRIAAQEDGSWRIPFSAGQAEMLPLAANSFDGSFAARLLLHAPDPVAVIREMLRVTRQGGRIVLMDWDFETTAIAHPNRTLTRRIIQWRTTHYGGDNWSGRQLLGYAVQAGVANLSVIPVATIARDEDAAFTQTLLRAASRAGEAGVITSSEAATWSATLNQLIADGRFMASILYFIVHGTAP